MADILQPTDQFLVNRADSTKTVTTENLMAELQDTDLMLVNRSDTTYKITGAEVKDSLQPSVQIDKPEILAPADGAGIGGGITYTPKTSEITDVQAVAGEWTLVNPGSGLGINSKPWNSIAYGNGVYVAVQGDGSTLIMNSPDAINWMSVYSTADGWTAIAYGAGTFVAVASPGSSGSMYTTDAGIFWQSASPGVTYLEDVIYANNEFVAISNTAVSGSQYAIAHSSDGQTWQNDISLQQASWRSIAYGDGTYVAVNSSAENRAAYSTDNMSTWTYVTMPGSGSWQSVRYGNGKFVAVAKNNPYMAWSEDGATWTAVNNGVAWYSITFDDGRFVAVGDAHSATSTDGINWSLTSVEGVAWKGVTYGDGKFVAVGDGYPECVSYSATGGASLADLTFADDKAYDKDTGDDNGQLIVDVFFPGDTVFGIGAVPTGKCLVAAATDPAFPDEDLAQFISAYNSGSSSTYCFIGCHKVGNYLEFNFGTAGTFQLIGGRTSGIDVNFAVTGDFSSGPSTGSFVSANSTFTWTLDAPGILRLTCTNDSNGFYILNYPSTKFDNSQFEMITKMAAGSVNSVSGQTMTVTPSGADPFINGMVVVKDGTVTIAAPSADDLQFVGSIPAASQAINVWGVARWMVSQSSDFSSPMVTTKTITPGTTQTLLPSERGEIVIESDKQYWTSLTYSAVAPESTSPVSDAVTFQTAPITPVLATPGQLYAMNAAGQPTPVISSPPNILFQNFASGGGAVNYIAGVGIDNKVYSGPQDLSSPLVETAAYGTDVSDLWFEYSGNGTWLALYSDGSINSNSGPSPFTDRSAVEIIALGGVTQVVVYKCVKADKSIGYVAYVGQYVGDRYVGSATIPVGVGYTDIDFSINGNSPKDICGIAGDYDCSQILMLGYDGKLYASGNAAQSDYHGITSFGTNTAPVIVTINGADNVNFVALATCASTYAGSGFSYASFSALTDDGDLWMAGGSDSSSGSVQFNKVGSDFKSVAVSSYGQDYWYALKTDGTLACGGPKSVVAVTTQLGPYAPSEPWNKLGTTPGKQNTQPAVTPFLIIPN